MASGSVYERVLGERIAELHPSLRAYFGEIPPGQVGRGTGSYEVAGSRHRWLAPVLALLARRQVLFPEYGHGIPFSVENRPDGDLLRARRTFEFPGRTRTMVDAMSVVDGVLHDRLGRRGGLEVELLLSVVDGALHMRSRRQWLHLGPVRFRMPGLVRVHLAETAGDGLQHVDVRMTAPVLGEVFRYSGRFEYAVAPEAQQSGSADGTTSRTK
ncbi:MAG: hypothetical protein JWP32_1826 [Schumannella sp.]|nr:hypothetical protein [Schumannella sp.]